MGIGLIFIFSLCFQNFRTNENVLFVSKIATVYRNILKKVLIFMIVTLGHIIDSKILGTGSAVRTAIIFFYISNEGISILENSARLRLPIPEKLKAVLYQIKKGDDGIGD